MDELSLKVPKLSLMRDGREDKEMHGSKNPKFKDPKTNSSMNFPEFHKALLFTDHKKSHNITKFLIFYVSIIKLDQLLSKAFLEMVVSYSRKLIYLLIPDETVTIINYLVL